METQSGLVVARELGEGMERTECLPMGMGLLFWGDGNVLEYASTDGYTIL